MKLRYVYLLCFLLCIDWSFCYECINGDQSLHLHRSIKRNAKSKHRKQKAQHQRMRRQESDEEKDAVASIDVANFIQQPDPDYEAIEDPMQYKNKKQESKYEDDYEFLNKIEMTLEKKNQDFQNSFDDLEGSNIQSGKELANTDKLVNNDFSSNIKRSSPEMKEGRKSSPRHPIPFFSHKSREKHEKKRKVFSFGSKKAASTTIMPSLIPKHDILKSDYNNRLIKDKRTGRVQRSCPLFIENSNEEDKAQKVIHNSRQYFQNIQKKESSDYNRYNNRHEEREKRKSDENFKLNFDDLLKNGFPQKQLQELDEIQKRIDALQINFPQGKEKNVERQE